MPGTQARHAWERTGFLQGGIDEGFDEGQESLILGRTESSCLGMDPALLGFVWRELQRTNKGVEVLQLGPL